MLGKPVSFWSWRQKYWTMYSQNSALQTLLSRLPPLAEQAVFLKYFFLYRKNLCIFWILFTWRAGDGWTALVLLLLHQAVLAHRLDEGANPAQEGGEALLSSFHICLQMSAKKSSKAVPLFPI